MSPCHCFGPQLIFTPPGRCFFLRAPLHMEWSLQHVGAKCIKWGVCAFHRRTHDWKWALNVHRVTPLHTMQGRRVGVGGRPVSAKTRMPYPSDVLEEERIAGDMDRHRVALRRVRPDVDNTQPFRPTAIVHRRESRAARGERFMLQRETPTAPQCCVRACDRSAGDSTA